MATRSKEVLFPLRPRLPPRPRSNLFAGFTAALAATLLFIVLVVSSLPASSPPPRRDIHTTSSPNPPAHCAAMSASLGEFGDLMLSMLPRDLAFTVFVPSPESFRRVLKLRPNDSTAAEGKASDGTYAVDSRVLGFSAVPRRLRSADVPLRGRVRLLDSVSGLKMYAWRDADGALVLNGVRSECVDVVREETVVHVMAGVLMDAEFERSFLRAVED